MHRKFSRLISCRYKEYRAFIFKRVLRRNESAYKGNNRSKASCCFRDFVGWINHTLKFGH